MHKTGLAKADFFDLHRFDLDWQLSFIQFRFQTIAIMSIGGARITQFHCKLPNKQPKSSKVDGNCRIAMKLNGIRYVE